MKSCTPLWREAHFEVKMYKAPQLRKTFRSCDVGKVHAVHAVVARSTCPRQNAQDTLMFRTAFGSLRCRKSACHCRREAHFQLKMYKVHHASEHFVEVEMSKKCTPLRSEAHFQGQKCTKHTQRSEHFLACSDVEKVYAVVARTKHISKSKVLKAFTACGPLLKVQMWFSRGRRKGVCTLSKVSKYVRVLRQVQPQRWKA